MGSSTLNVHNISAKVLDNVIHLSSSKIKFYVVVEISGGYKDAEEETPLATEEGVTNIPTWNNYDMNFFVNGKECLDLKLYGKRAFMKKKLVGEVRVPLQVIMKQDETTVSYPLYKKQKRRGEITFSYKFMDQNLQQAGSVESSVKASPDPLDDSQAPSGAANNPKKSGNPPPTMNKQQSKRSKFPIDKIGAGLGFFGLNVAGAIATDAITNLVYGDEEGEDQADDDQYEEEEEEL